MSKTEKAWHESQMQAARQALATKQIAAHEYAAQVRAKNPAMLVQKGEYK